MFTVGVAGAFRALEADRGPSDSSILQPGPRESLPHAAAADFFRLQVTGHRRGHQS